MTLEESNVQRLASMGLPADYLSRTPKEKQRARIRALTAWFDPKRPNILCTDVEKYVQAQRLWVEFYLKPDPYMQAKYYYADPLHKYDMVRMLMAEPRVERRAKTLIIAPRKTTKTVSLIHEPCSMIPVVRPSSHIVISEMNATRTEEEMENIRLIIENCETIHRDFGGRGKLFPNTRGAGDKWNTKTLGFRRYNGSTLSGVSAGSKHRGRHPILYIMDDPDDGELSRNPEWRMKFFDWLFRTAMPMVIPGGKFCWIQTVTGKECLVTVPLQGFRRETAPDDMDAMSGPVEHDRDERFDDWIISPFRLYEEDDQGELTRSLWPEYAPEGGFDSLVKTYGYAEAMAEFQAEVVAGGHRQFHRDRYRHGYLRAEGEDQKFIDLKTGETRNWTEWLGTLDIVLGVDFADSMRADACPAAIVVGGYDRQGVIYILDVIQKRLGVESLIEEVLLVVCQTWSVSEAWWEVDQYQTVFYRWADRFSEILKREGYDVPAHKKIENRNKNKIKRIIGGLTRLFSECRIKFPEFDEFTDDDGVVHKPVAHPNRRSIRKLKEQVDNFTDEGGVGFIDALDALEMMVRGAWNRRSRMRAAQPDPIEEDLEEWKRIGFEFDRTRIAPKYWTKEMRRGVAEPVGGGRYDQLFDEVDPYE